MQTFLPDKDFTKSLACLDNKRLGKQRTEADVILNVLLGKSTGWARHPAVKMWVGYTNALIEYRNTSIDVWVKRGYKNSYLFVDFIETETFADPPWLGNEAFHASHRSNLLRKHPEFYGKFGWTESPDLPYFWPSKELVE